MDVRYICAGNDFLPVNNGKVCREYDEATGQCKLNGSLCYWRKLDPENSISLRASWKKNLLEEKAQA